jgi:hypothetical protein
MNEPLQFVGVTPDGVDGIRSVYLYTQLPGVFMRPISYSSDFDAWTVGYGPTKVKFDTSAAGSDINIHKSNLAVWGSTTLYKCWNYHLRALVVSFNNPDGKCIPCTLRLEWVAWDELPGPPPSITQIQITTSNPTSDAVSSVGEEDSLTESLLHGDPNHDLDMNGSRPQAIPELASPFHLYVRFGEFGQRLYLYLTTVNLDVSKDFYL